MILASVVLSVVWVVSAGGRAALTPLRVWGYGFVIFGVGLLPLAAGLASGGAPFVLGTVITAVGEAAIAPIVTTYAVLAVKPRASALSVALMSLVGWLSFSFSPGPALGVPVMILGGLACLAIGVAAARYAPQIHARFFVASGAQAPRRPNQASRSIP